MDNILNNYQVHRFYELLVRIKSAPKINGGPLIIEDLEAILKLVTFDSRNLKRWRKK